jgi:hypothetical protein
MMKAKKLSVTIAVTGLFGLPALAAGLAGWRAVPRDICHWGAAEFCSEYGSLYWAICGAFSLLLALSLWAIHRRHEG